MNPERNKRMLLELYDAVVGRHWDAVRALLTADFVDHNPDARAAPGTNGREAFIAYFRDGETPLHGAQVEIQRMIADAEYAVVHYKLREPAAAARSRGGRHLPRRRRALLRALGRAAGHPGRRAEPRAMFERAARTHGGARLPSPS